MKVIGLTGGSGVGKGAVCAILLRYGVPAVDTDGVYHAILARKDGCTAELAEAFGREILSEDGAVDRKRLAAAVFGKTNTPALLHTLNSITHKYIMAETHALLREFAQNGARAAVIDAPQLFEAGAEADCDVVLGIVADRALRISRIVTRDGIPEEAAQRRINAQHDDAFYLEHCDAVLTNNGDLRELEEQVKDFLLKFNVGLS